MTTAVRTLTLVTCFAIVAAACGGTAATTTTTTGPSTTTTSVATTTTGVTTTTTATTTTTTTPPESEEAVVYFFVDSVDGEGAHLVPVWRGDSAANTPEGAIAALLAGPLPDEVAGIPAISTTVPTNVRLLGVEVAGGVATIDLSGEFGSGGGSASMFGRLAQLVFTATRDPAIDAVVLAIDGSVVDVFSSEGIVLDQPLTREAYVDDHLPAIFVDRPAWGQPVTSPVEVSGIANVFEAAFLVMLTDDDGLPLAEVPVMASCGTGCWGTFDLDLPYTVDRDQFGALIVWADSSMDGSPIEVREYPVRLTGGR